jgi:hypothetical protein
MKLEKVTDLIAENIDELAAVSEIWKRMRADNVMPKGVRKAIIHLCSEITTQVQLEDAELLKSSAGPGAFILSDEGKAKLRNKQIADEVNRQNQASATFRDPYHN